MALCWQNSSRSTEKNLNWIVNLSAMKRILLWMLSFSSSVASASKTSPVVSSTILHLYLRNTSKALVVLCWMGVRDTRCFSRTELWRDWRNLWTPFRILFQLQLVLIPRKPLTDPDRDWASQLLRVRSSTYRRRHFPECSYGNVRYRLHLSRDNLLTLVTPYEMMFEFISTSLCNWYHMPWYSIFSELINYYRIQSFRWGLNEISTYVQMRCRPSNQLEYSDDKAYTYRCVVNIDSTWVILMENQSC
jgi:hypothetical protein